MRANVNNAGRAARGWEFGFGAGRVARAACAVAVAAALTLGTPFAGVALADGDGSAAGSVSSSDSTSATAKTDVSKARADAAAADSDAATGNGETAEEPQPVDDPGNSIDDGQTSDNSFLYDAAIGDLAGADSYYDGQTVQVTGEVVGEAIAVSGDADHVWIVLRDPGTGSTVTVFLRRSDERKIDTFGAYGSTGTTLRVRGTFNLACSQHEGESDVHAQVVSTVSSGYQHKEEFNIEDFKPGAAMLAIGGVLAFVFWRMRERSR